MATTDVSLIEFSAIPNLDPSRQVLATWKLLVRDDVTNEVWEAIPGQFKGVILPAVIPGSQSAPAVSLTLSASTGIIGVIATLSATATSGSSTIAKVEFFDSGVKVGASAAQPYQVSYTPAATGRHTLVAVATDANGTATTSAAQFLDVSALAPAAILINLVPLPPGSVGTALALVAAASVVGDTITKVEFFDGASIVGVSTTTPYGCSYVPTTPGPHYFSAKATTSTGASAISPALTVQVVQPLTITDQPPSVSLSATATNFTLGGTTTLSALAADVDGAVVRVDFYDGTTLLSSQSSQGPYAFDYIPTKTGGHALSAKATDNLGSFTTASLNITVNAVAALPAAPTNVVGAYLPIGASQFSTAVIVVNWLAPPAVAGAPVTSYNIYRNGLLVAASQALNYSDTNIKPGDSPYYAVAALSGTIMGPLSLQSLNVTVPTATAAPTPVVVAPVVVAPVVVAPVVVVPTAVVAGPSYHGPVATTTPTALTMQTATATMITESTWASAPRSISYNCSGTYPSFAEPQAYGLRTLIKDVNGFNVTSNITQTAVTYVVGGVSIPYYLYVHQNAQYSTAFILNF